MFTKAEIKNNLLGCFEIFLFMRKGVERFSPSQKAALKSCIWIPVFLPLTLFVISFQNEGTPNGLFYLFYPMKVCVVLGSFYGIVYLISKYCEKQEHFFRFVTIINWINVPLILLIMPAIFVLVSAQTYGAVESYALFLTIVSHILTGFIATHALRLPWQLGATIAIIGIGVHDIGFRLGDLLKEHFFIV